MTPSDDRHDEEGELEGNIREARRCPIIELLEILFQIFPMLYEKHSKSTIAKKHYLLSPSN